MNSLMKHRLAAGSALLLLAVGACGGADDASSKAQPSAEAGASGEEAASARAGAAAPETDEADQDAMREAEEAAEEAVDDSAGLMDAVYVADAGAVIRVEPATYGETGDALLKLAALQTEAPEGGDAPAGDALAGLGGDPVRGERIFRQQCMACHTVQAGQNRVGPSLHGIIGKAAGSVPRFNYSPANKNSDVVWTEETMFEYLKNPREFMPGTRMIFAGSPKEQDRADLIAYIKSASE